MPRKHRTVYLVVGKRSSASWSTTWIGKRSYSDGQSRTSHISQSFLGSVHCHLFKRSDKEKSTWSELISAQGGGLGWMACLHWTHVSSRAGSGMRRHWDPWLQCNGPLESRSHPLTRLWFYCKSRLYFPLIWCCQKCCAYPPQSWL